MKMQGTQPLFVLLCAAAVTFCNSQAIEKEVVVIGGGIAGLAAARQIVNRGRGRFSVHVYEARRERYGGRVWTNRLKNPRARGLEVDLGGNTLNVVNQLTNPLLNLTRDLELETATISNAQFIVPWLNKKYSDDELMQAMIQASTIISDAVNSTRHQGTDRSIKDAIDSQLKEKGVGKEDVRSLLLRSLPSYVISEYSALHYQADSLDFGYEQVLLDGMGELMDRLVSGSEDEKPMKIRLRTAVRQVKVDRSQGKVTLRLKDGSQVTVDEVIVAVPAPVIAKGDLLFEPSLPKEYQWAVSQIGMSDGNKVVVEFDVPFWPNDHGVFIAAAQHEDDRGFLQTWLNIHKVLGKPVLVGLLFGDAARRFESLSDEEVKDSVLQKLQSVFGNDAVSSKNIVKILRSAWTSDQWSGGASSYPKVGNVPKLWDTFAEPLCPNVYFAGEHTVFRGHGTLHGAYASGIRAADLLLSSYCEEKAKEEERKRKEEARRKVELKKKKKEQGLDTEDDEEKEEEQTGEEETVEEIDESVKKEVKDEL
ncbi:uncharacterized protein [Littorina saxatilis]|uniref:Amine oxidase n=1 Tax=Littorina saxatilis TaxID=31220 RepID=A0AAN9G183_9CAEN